MEKHLRAARTLAKLLDNQFEVFGFKFGLDPIIGLIPWFGDVVAFGLGAYLIWIGHKMKIPGHQLRRMYGYLIFDFVAGLIPWVGDIADFIVKANSRNLKILEKREE